MLTLYKANKAVKGSMISFKLTATSDKDNRKKNGVYVQLKKQTGWDAQRSKGTFKDGEDIIVKLSCSEAAEACEALRRGKSVKFPHFTDDYVTQIFLTANIGDDKKVSHFNFTVSRTSRQNKDKKTSISTKIAVGKYDGDYTSIGENFLVARWFDYALEQLFDAEYRAEIKRLKEYTEKKKSVSPKEDVVEEDEETSF